MQNWRQGWRSRKKSFHGWSRLFDSFEELSGLLGDPLNWEPALFSEVKSSVMPIRSYINQNQSHSIHKEVMPPLGLNQCIHQQSIMERRLSWTLKCNLFMWPNNGCDKGHVCLVNQRVWNWQKFRKCLSLIFRTKIGCWGVLCLLPRVSTPWWLSAEQSFEIKSHFFTF